MLCWWPVMSLTPARATPGLYCRFLCWGRLFLPACCRYRGQTRSPSGSPQELLKALNVHVVGSSSESLEDEVLVLRSELNAPELIVCAVPYLRDRDIRVAEAGERVEDKEGKLLAGIRSHYAEVAAFAEQKREELGVDIPIVAMGHLFTAGGQTVDGDGVRELYVGSLAHVTAGIFPASFDYLALGHLQSSEGEWPRDHQVQWLPSAHGVQRQNSKRAFAWLFLIMKRPGQAAIVQLIDVPVFQKLERVKETGRASLPWIELSATTFKAGSGHLRR